MDLAHKYSRQSRMVRLWDVYRRNVDTNTFLGLHKTVRTRRRAQGIAQALCGNDNRMWVEIVASGHSRLAWYSCLLKKHGAGHTYEEHHFSSTPLSVVERRTVYRERWHGRK